MNDATEKRPEKRRGWWWKIPLGFFLLLLLGLFIVVLNIDAIALTQTNKALNRFLPGGGSLEAIDIRLSEGRIDLAGLKINQPHGFGSEPIFFLEAFALDVGLAELLKGEILAERIVVKSLSVIVVRDKQGQLSPLKLLQKAETQPEKKPGEGGEMRDLLMIPAVRVDSIRIENLSVQLIDHMIGENWSAGFQLDLAVDGVKLNDLLEQDILVSMVDLVVKKVKVDQLAGFSKSTLLALDKIELTAADIDLGTSRLPIDKVMVDNIDISVERSKAGEVNLIKLVSSWLPVAAETIQPDKPAAEQLSDEEKAAPAFVIPTLMVEDVQLRDIAMQLKDRSISETWRASFDRLDVSLAKLEVGDITKQKILLGSFAVDLKGIGVDQPAGYSDTALLSVDKVELASTGIDLSTSRLPIDKVLVDTVKVSLESNAEREINLLKLVEIWMPVASEPEQQKETEAKKAPVDQKAAPIFPIPTLAVKDIQLKSIMTRVKALSLGDDWRAGIKNLDISIKGVEVGDIARQKISLDSFMLDLEEISADQPPGFGTGHIAGMKRVAVKTDRFDLGASETAVKQVLVQGPSASVIMNKEGRGNLQDLVEGLFGKQTKTGKNKARKEPKLKESAPDMPLKTVLFEHILVKDGSFRLRDESLTKEALEIPLNRLQVQSKQLRLFDRNKKALPGSVSVSFEIGQPNELPTAYFGTVAKVGPYTIGSTVPPVNSQIRLTGFKLDTLGKLVPPATRTALGATGFDADMAMSLNNDRINVDASILSDKNVNYKALQVRGPLNAPKMKVGAVLSGVFSRVTDGMANLGKRGFGTGTEIVEGSVDTVKKMGSGTVNIGRKLGSGLLDTAAGLITFDKDKTKSGLSGATKGTIDVTAESVKNTGRAAGGGLKGSVIGLKGEELLRAWDEGIPERYTAAMQQAMEELDQMSYPPVTD